MAKERNGYLSIASEITRINTNIAAAYTACGNKGANLPQVQNSANLAVTISGISTGITPLGTKSITSNGIHDVTQYASANVNVPAGVFPTKQTYTQVNSPVAAYLANASYSPSDYSSSVIETYAVGTTGKDRPDGAAVTLPSAGTLTIQDGARSYSVAVSAGNYTIYNITPGGTGTYTLRDSSDNIVAAGVLKPTGVLRMINGGGDTFNIRDLGGWTCDGGTIKYGMVFRGGELNGDNVTLTNDQKRLFRDLLGIRSEIDLRGNSDVDGDDDIYGTADDITSSALGDDVNYLRRAIAAYAGGVDLTNATQCDYYRDIFKQLAADALSSRPCYIHCVVGADRTGTVCALIEALCGAAQSDIDKDYELTAFCGELRARYVSTWVGLMTYLNSLPGDNLRDRTVYYLYQIGVTIDEMNALRRSIIYGNPADVVAPVPSYTNLLPLSEYPVGTASGVMNGKRWSSSGTLKDKESSVSYAKASGYIELETGTNVVRMSGVRFGASSVQKDTGAYIQLYNGSQAVQNMLYAGQLSNLPTSLNGLTNMQYDANGDLIQFTLTRSSSCVYFTICTNSTQSDGGIADDAVLTINEPI